MSFPVDEPIVYLITKGEATAWNFGEKSRAILDIIRVAVEERVSLVQLREKNLSVRLLFELTNDVASITRGSVTRLLVNDRADIAIAAKADGVHLTAYSVPVDVIRKTFPREFIIGVSTHTIDSTLNASANGADFAVFGPIYETPNKGEPHGIEKLTEVCERVGPFPVLALGGIKESNISAIVEAGAAGFAAIRALNDPGSMRTIRRNLKK